MKCLPKYEHRSLTAGFHFCTIVLCSVGKKKDLCCLRLYDITLLTAKIAKCKSVCGVVCHGGSTASWSATSLSSLWKENLAQRKVENGINLSFTALLQKDAMLYGLMCGNEHWSWHVANFSIRLHAFIATVRHIIIICGSSGEGKDPRWVFPTCLGSSRLYFVCVSLSGFGSSFLPKEESVTAAPEVEVSKDYQASSQVTFQILLF